MFRNSNIHSDVNYVRFAIRLLILYTVLSIYIYKWRSPARVTVLPFITWDYLVNSSARKMPHFLKTKVQWLFLKISTIHVFPPCLIGRIWRCSEGSWWQAGRRWLHGNVVRTVPKDSANIWGKLALMYVCMRSPLPPPPSSLQQFSKTYAADVLFYKVDVDENSVSVYACPQVGKKSAVPFQCD